MNSGVDIPQGIAPPHDLGRLRGKERVRTYLLAEFGRPQMVEGSRLPTNRELAEQLGVSVPTVHAAKQKLVEEGRIRTRAGSGTFLVAKPSLPRKEYRIAVSGPLSGGSARGERIARIVGGIFSAASIAQPRVTLAPLAPELEETEAGIEKLIAERADVDGMILFSHWFPDAVRRQISEAYEREGKPVVLLYPFTDTGTANFVAPDYFTACCQLGRAWRKSGRRNILMISHVPPAESVSLRFRRAGLIRGLGDEVGNTITLRTVSVIGSASDEETYRTVRACLTDSAFVPDAIYAAGGVNLPGILQAVRERGIEIPTALSLFGGAWIEHGAARVPTCFEEPSEQLGEALFQMVWQRLQQKATPVPGRFLPLTLNVGDTTCAEENEVLRSAEPLGNASAAVGRQREDSVQERNTR
jgi:DNA-binding LacI/PurR family transcriptional regulator